MLIRNPNVWHFATNYFKRNELLYSFAEGAKGSYGNWPQYWDGLYTSPSSSKTIAWLNKFNVHLFYWFSFLRRIYFRLKSGNPGYFVVYNPTDADVAADFSSVKSLPEELTFELASKPYENNAATKVPTDAIPLQANSAVVFTYAYAPKSAE